MAYVDYKLCDPYRTHGAIIETPATKWSLPAGTKLNVAKAKLRMVQRLDLQLLL